MNERKDLWKDSIDRKFVTNLADKISQVYPSFDKKQYVKTVIADRFFERELKDRLNTLARHFKQFLPANYKQATGILVKAAPLAGEFSNWALTSYVEQFGQEQFELSIAALKELTKYGSSEFGIRPFVNQDPDRMIEIFREWATDANHHVRRLAAEGSRPRGVWVAHIPKYKHDPKGVLTILELLKQDDSLYVRKAVANNLNDISKDNPDAALKTSRQWLKTDHPHTDWIVKHGLRTLIKKGDTTALSLLGFNRDDALSLGPIKLDRKRIRIGDAIQFSFEINSTAKKRTNLMIDYRIGFAKKSGRRSDKVFKLRKTALEPGQKIEITSEHSFADLSTRTHHPGEHTLSILVNGVESKPILFLVIPS